MKVIIAGSREITDPTILDAALDSCPFYDRITEVVSGGAGGVDRLGECFAGDVEPSIPVRVFPADWKNLGYAAGPIRNREMAKYADALIAIPHPDPKKRKGTSNMIYEAEKRGLLVHIYIPT